MLLCVLLYCTVIYCPILHCNTLLPVIYPFAVNNNINIRVKILYENMEQRTQKVLNLLHRATRNSKVVIHSTLKSSVLIMVI